jgi:PTH2 family peptidyl-tRNA hydrolase
METVKQVIIIRKDLNMRKGKMCAQAAHASMKVFFDKIIETTQHAFHVDIKIQLTPQMLEWVQGKFTKIVVSCPDLETMLQLEAKAKEANIPNALITDSGATEFNGVPTVTALAIGPDESDIIDKITGELPLL